MLERFFGIGRGEAEPYPLGLVEEATAILVASERSVADGDRPVLLREVLASGNQRREHPDGNGPSTRAPA